MDYAQQQLYLALQRQDNDKSGAQTGAQDYSSCGPPNWDRASWEAFKNQYGHYPFGLQGDGSFISPPHYDGAPDWVFELMGQRTPPIRMRRPTG